MRKVRVPISILSISFFFFLSCEPDNNRLGVDIFPPGDTILVFTDTISDFETRLVRSRPRITSESSQTATNTRAFLLGSKRDSLTGLSKADIVTSLTIITAGAFGDDPLVDSLILSLYVTQVDGDTTQEMRILVYEFLDTLFYENDYYSDYDISGKYDPEPLVDRNIIPKPNTYYEFNITDPEYVQRVLDAARDTVFQYRSLVEDKFRGLYITTETVEEGGALVKVQLANGLSGLKFRYLHDSIDIDTATLSDYRSYSMNFNESYAEKVNIFTHDFTGTAIEDYVDNPDAEPPIAYAQGMAGVNTKISIPGFEDYLGEGLIALNAANLLFFIVPDSLSGIPREQYPAKLMIETLHSDDTYIPIYDQVISSNTSSFGKLNQSNEFSAFLDPRYFYAFQVGRHLQSVISGEIENGDLIIYVDNPSSTAQVIKFWSNYSGMNGGLKLELIYTKF
jgi:hypothetical protein